MARNGLELVLCAGMRRGGSTLQAQYAAAILGMSKIDLVTPETLESFLVSNRDSGETLVAKCHRFVPNIRELRTRYGLKVLYVYRDIRDVLASIATKYDTPPHLHLHGGLRKILEEYRDWTSLEDVYVGRYERMIAEPKREVQRIAGFLHITLTDTRAEEIATEYSLQRQIERIDTAAQDPEAIEGEGRNRYDRSSLLHLNHIATGSSGGFSNILSKPVIGAIEWQCRRWMAAQGYPASISPIYQWGAHLAFQARAQAGRMYRMIRLDRAGRLRDPD